MKKLLIVGIFTILLIVTGLTYYFLNYDNKLAELDKITTDRDYKNIIYEKAENVFKEDVLGILTIEKIGLEATVKEGSDSQVLKEYIGHIEGTSTYDGNIGLARTQ